MGVNSRTFFPEVTTRSRNSHSVETKSKKTLMRHHQKKERYGYNDLTAYWQAYRLDQKWRREKRHPMRVEEIMKLRQIGFKVIALTRWQYRINDRLDVYPIHNRWHDIRTHRRGGYPAVTGFVQSFFKDVEEQSRNRVGAGQLLRGDKYQSSDGQVQRTVGIEHPVEGPAVDRGDHGTDGGTGGGSGPERPAVLREWITWLLDRVQGWYDGRKVDKSK